MNGGNAVMSIHKLGTDRRIAFQLFYGWYIESYFVGDIIHKVYKTK